MIAPKMKTHAGSTVTHCNGLFAYRRSREGLYPSGYYPLLHCQYQKSIFIYFLLLPSSPVYAAVARTVLPYQM